MTAAGPHASLRSAKIHIDNNFAFSKNRKTDEKERWCIYALWGVRSDAYGGNRRGPDGWFAPVSRARPHGNGRFQRLLDHVPIIVPGQQEPAIGQKIDDGHLVDFDPQHDQACRLASAVAADLLGG